MIRLTARRDAVARTRAAAVATLGANILTRLSSHDSRAALRRELTELATILRDQGVTLALSAAELRANDAALPAHVSNVWRDALTAAHVREVRFARETSERELLLFLALLHAPGDAAAFETPWLASGAWRIHVVSESSAPDTANEAPLVLPADRSGAESTAALLAELAVATCGSRRRALFEGILAIRGGEAEIMAALSSPDWFMVRNAAALLGELHVRQADAVLAALLQHTEPRVRIAVATALGQLDTPTAHTALTAAVNDPEAVVREHAWTAWAHCSVAPAAVLLDQALRHEEDALVQQALLDCAAAFPTLDVGGGLIRFCAREFTRHAPLERVVAGVEQLAMRRPESAKAFVQRLSEQYGRTALLSRAS